MTLVLLSSKLVASPFLILVLYAFDPLNGRIQYTVFYKSGSLLLYNIGEGVVFVRGPHRITKRVYYPLAVLLFFVQVLSTITATQQQQKQQKQQHAFSILTLAEFNGLYVFFFSFIISGVIILQKRHSFAV